MIKKYILIILCLLFICITGCKDTVSDIKNKTINQTETTETSKTKKDNEILESSKKLEIKVIYDKDKKLKLVNLTKKEKDKIFSDFLKSRFNIYLSKNENVKIPYETKITKNLDKYTDVCYSIYKYKKDKLFAFLLREKYDPSRSYLLSNTTVYVGLFLIPVDKVYTIEDFSEIIVNKSDLSDVKKIYKYADVLLKQEIENSKKKCSINIMSEDSGITINFKKSGDKYIVTKIKNGAKDTFVSMIADVDKTALS